MEEPPRKTQKLEGIDAGRKHIEMWRKVVGMVGGDRNTQAVGCGTKDDDEQEMRRMSRVGREPKGGDEEQYGEYDVFILGLVAELEDVQRKLKTNEVRGRGKEQPNLEYTGFWLNAYRRYTQETKVVFEGTADGNENGLCREFYRTAAGGERAIILNFAGVDKKPSAEIRREQRKGHRRDVERAASADFGMMMTSRPSAYTLCFQTTITIKRGSPECGAKEVLCRLVTSEASKTRLRPCVVSLKIAIRIFDVEVWSRIFMSDTYFHRSPSQARSELVNPLRTWKNCIFRYI
ncbi:hypothetical protein EV421DRAFT_2024611 [Armillaria borealis]|uniref:Uncharacterized protein n=1 Tax=Armillaria borealis TaxID=47425 RepID=A0AA39IVP3_9AGAR|nr:hypothetical protein EV421DRAFT_2024611 [Armillaria borealis]